MPDEERNRRMYDEVIPIVMLQVEERIRDTRHSLRQEMAVIATSVQTGQVQASREHEAVRSDIADLKRSVEDLTPVLKTVEDLKERDIADHAHDDAIAGLRKAIWAGVAILITAIAAVNGVVALFLHH